MGNGYLARLADCLRPSSLAQTRLLFCDLIPPARGEDAVFVLAGKAAIARAALARLHYQSPLIESV